MEDVISFIMVRYMNSVNRTVPIFAIHTLYLSMITYYLPGKLLLRQQHPGVANRLQQGVNIKISLKDIMYG